MVNSEKVSKYSHTNKFHESKDQWCTECEEVYQHACAVDYINVYHPHGESIDEMKKEFYSNYHSMLKNIDQNILNNPNITPQEIKDAIEIGYSASNFLDTCIALRLNHHRNCIRAETDLYKNINNINPLNLQGDKGHKDFIDELRRLKTLGTKIYNNASKHPNKTTKVVKRSKRNNKSRPKTKKTLRSRRIRSLVRKKRESKEY